MTETSAGRPLILRATDPADVSRMGGKAAALAELIAAGFPVPEFLVIPPEAFAASGPGRFQGAGMVSKGGSDDSVAGDPEPGPELLDQIRTEVSLWSRTDDASTSPDQRSAGTTIAVRSSGIDEDGSGHTFAGQFDSYLFVRPEDLAGRIADVWRSGFGERVLAYRREHDLGAGSAPAVLIQRMIDAEVSGVAFSADPVSGRRTIVVVSAVYGLGTALVGGDVDADTYRVDADGTILEREVARKTLAHRAAIGSPTGVAGGGVAGGGVVEVGVPAELAELAALDDEQVRAVAELARDAESHFERPQDIEWALRGGELFLLQSRPITSLSRIPDPDGIRNVWDNSNIVESYSGITTPLTFSFALGAYEGVYREFCRILGVPAARIEANGPTFARMLGLVRGRVYYNLLNWYRVLALLPGFTVNRAFMESMMGVREGLPDEVAAELAAASRGKVRDRFDLIRAILGLLSNHWFLSRNIRRFYGRLDDALAPPATPLARMRLDQLATEYRRLEERLLTRWDAPLINDFFAMIHFGVLGKLTAKWCGDEKGTLQNDLVSSQGGMISAEPAQRIMEMAALVREQDAAGRPEGRGLGELLRRGAISEARRAIHATPELGPTYDEYLARFGDRCLDELKLESTTLLDDPTPLVRAIGNTAAGAARSANRANLPEVAEDRVRASLGRNPIRRVIFAWVLRNARHRVRDRENLRFERTRLFGRVRRIFLEIGKRLWAEGRLDDSRDVFYLEVREILGFIEGTATSDDLAGLARVRRRRFEEYALEQKPADRFETRGAVYIANDFLARTPRNRHAGTSNGAGTDTRDGIRLGASDESGPGAHHNQAGAPTDGSSPDLLVGLGCCPGVVRGPVRVIRDPRGASLEDGEILVAERTDPGWILLFPSAAAILVERGSLLSHSAIVAREMGIPAIVSIPGITELLRDGEWVEMDGSSGEVRRIPAGQS